MFACGKVVKCPSQKRVGFSKTARNIRLKIVSWFIFWNHGTTLWSVNEVAAGDPKKPKRPK